METISQSERDHDGQSEAARERRHGQRDAERRRKTSIVNGIAPSHGIANGQAGAENGMAAVVNRVTPTTTSGIVTQPQAWREDENIEWRRGRGARATNEDIDS
jgi:hypothetical protein